MLFSFCLHENSWNWLENDQRTEQYFNCISNKARNSANSTSQCWFPCMYLKPLISAPVALYAENSAGLCLQMVFLFSVNCAWLRFHILWNYADKSGAVCFDAEFTIFPFPKESKHSNSPFHTIIFKGADKCTALRYNDCTCELSLHFYAKNGHSLHNCYDLVYYSWILY